jgi:hypothetical protein
MNEYSDTPESQFFSGFPHSDYAVRAAQSVIRRTSKIFSFLHQ